MQFRTKNIRYIKKKGLKTPTRETQDKEIITTNKRFVI